jgi:hypothetical protein
MPLSPMPIPPAIWKVGATLEARGNIEHRTPNMEHRSEEHDRPAQAIWEAGFFANQNFVGRPPRRGMALHGGEAEGAISELGQRRPRGMKQTQKNRLQNW